MDPEEAYQNPARLLQHLIRFDTTNPPGNEEACVAFIEELLHDAGIETERFSDESGRPNLVARLSGRGEAEPLLLYGHVDVVPVTGQAWRYPPFEARIADGYVWGRGALDMKGGVAMMLAAFLRAKLEQTPPAGDVMLLILSDEEAGGDHGARWLTQNHPELFAGIRHAIGEFGGFSLTVGGKRFYPIQVAEKQLCWLKATLHGEGGHGSLSVRGGAMAKLGRMLSRLDRNRLPVHITPATRMMFESMAKEIGGIRGWLLKQLLTPALTDTILTLMGKGGKLFDPMLHNTVSPTILHGGHSINVIPNTVSVELDGRILPGQTPEDLIRQLRAVVGDEVTFELIRHDAGTDEPDMERFEMLSDILLALDPDAIPVPMLLTGVTDGRFFAPLGIQTYGFLPMRLPEDFNFSQTIHAPDERIPVEAVGFGAEAIYRAIC